MKKTHSMDLTRGSLLPLIMRFALPLMATHLVSYSFNIADMVVVGKFAGDSAQAAVSSTGALVATFLGLFIGISVGINVVVAQALGAGELDRIGKVVHTSILMALVTGVVLSVAGILLTPFMLRLMDTPQNVMESAVIYLRIYFLGVPAMLVYNFGSALLRADGDTRRPLIYNIEAGLVNVALNLLFVIGFKWSVAGVAIATVVSQVLSAAMVLHCLCHETGVLQLHLRELSIDPESLRDIAKIGLPAGLQGTLFNLGSTVIQSSINSLGEVAMAGSGAAASLSTIINTPATVGNNSATTFAGQNFGAGDMRRAERSLLYILAVNMGLTAVLSLLAWIFRYPLYGIYSNSPEVIEAAIVRAFWVSNPCLLCVALDTLSGYLRGFGYATSPMIITLIGACGLRVVWCQTIFRLFPTADVLFAVFPVSWVVTEGVLAIFYFAVRKKLYARAEENRKSRQTQQ